MTGELAALAAAILWALATVGFGRIGRRVPPSELNLHKGLIAGCFLLLVLLARGSLGVALDRPALALLLVSGALGIGVGDTAYFESLQLLGSRRALLLGVLAPPVTALVALLFLAERLAALAWVGIFLAVAGIVWVIAERVPGRGGAPERRLRGVLAGLLAAVGQAVGAVLSHAALTRSGIDLFWSALLRLGAGTVVLMLWIALRRQPLLAWRRAPGCGRLVVALVGVSFVGTFLCLVLQQAALRHTDAGIAQTLISTSPLFVLPLAAALGERVTLRAVLGALVAVAGIALLFGARG